MAHKLLNYLYPGSVTSVTTCQRTLRIEYINGLGWVGLPATNVEYPRLNPENITDNDESTYLSQTLPPDFHGQYLDIDYTAVGQLTFHITTAYKWSPRYLFLKYNLNSGSLSNITCTFYKGATVLGTTTFSLTVGTNYILAPFTLTGTDSDIYSPGSFKLVWNKDVATGQTLKIYTLELGEYRFASLKQRINKLNGATIGYNTSSQVHTIDMFASQANEVTVPSSVYPLRIKRESSGTAKLALLTTASNQHSSTYDQGISYYKLLGKPEATTIHLKYVAARNFFYNSGCGSSTLYPNLSAEVFTPPAAVNGIYARTTAFFTFYKTSAVGAGDAIGYLSNNSTTDIHDLNELGTSVDRKVVLGVTPGLVGGDNASLILEEYYSGAWHSVITVDLAPIKGSRVRLTQAGTIHLNTQTVTGIRAYIFIPSAEVENTIVSLDDLFLGMVE